MRKKMIYAIVALLILVLAAGIETSYASRRGGHSRDGGHSAQFSSFHRRGFSNRRFVHRNFFHRPGIVIRYSSPYYYYPYRFYQCSYGCDPYKRPAYNYSTSSLSLTAIVDMTRQGLPDEAIIDEINRTRSTFRLNAEIINYLKTNNVSDRVIDFMLASNRY
jgi:hypothetical protein